MVLDEDDPAQKKCVDEVRRGPKPISRRQLSTGKPRRRPDRLKLYGVGEAGCFGPPLRSPRAAANRQERCVFATVWERRIFGRAGFRSRPEADVCVARIRLGTADLGNCTASWWMRCRNSSATSCTTRPTALSDCLGRRSFSSGAPAGFTLTAIGGSFRQLPRPWKAGSQITYGLLRKSLNCRRKLLYIRNSQLYSKLLKHYENNNSLVLETYSPYIYSCIHTPWH